MLQGRAAHLEEQRAILADRIDESALRHSAVKNLIWKIRDNTILRKIRQTEAAYRHSARGDARIGSNLLIAGTRFPAGDTRIPTPDRRG